MSTTTTNTTSVHPVFAPVAPVASSCVEEATDHLARVDALLKVYESPTDDQWRAAYRKFVHRMVVAAHGHRRDAVPTGQLSRTIRSARERFCEIHGGEYGLDFARLYPATRPDKGVVEVLRAQEGVTGLGLWSSSRKEFVP